MSILLAFMLKELSRQASCDICRNQLEFSDYYVVYYVYVTGFGKTDHNVTFEISRNTDLKY